MSRKDKAVLVVVIIIGIALSALISWAAYQADPGGMGPDAFAYGWPQTVLGFGWRPGTVEIIGEGSDAVQSPSSEFRR